MLIKRIDPLTGEEFIPKKISQKFASPSNRIMFNNQKANKLRQERSFIDKLVHKNHRILREIYNPEQDNIFNSHWLRGKGYELKAYNHIEKYKGQFTIAVYEFLVIDTGIDDKIKIVKHGRL